MEVGLNEKISKLAKSALQMSRYEQMFKCPICQSTMKIVDLKSLICHQNHTFDIARQGHINLLTRPSKSNYDKSLFAARRKVMVEGKLFNPLMNEITERININTNDCSELIIADMGTGEGSHLNHIRQKLDNTYNITSHAFGIDISKEGILEAAKHYSGITWLVADLANSPFNNHRFDVILNILSPSNYKEFKRILKHNGIIIKVVPGERHLQEIRHFFYKNRKQTEYTNEEIVKGFQDNFHLVEHLGLEYHQKLNRDNLKALLQMTPLTWNFSEDQREGFLQHEMNVITLHLVILIGKKKRE